MLLSCTASAPPAARLVSPHAVTSEPMPLRSEVVPTTIVTPTAVFDVAELFVTGQTLLRQGNPGDAAEAFDRILQHDPAGPFAERALFQGALAHEAAVDLEGAARRFEELARRFPAARRSEEALVRSMRVRLHLEQWQLAGQAAAVFLQRYPDAAPSGRIVAYAARGLGLLAEGRSADAEYAIGKGMEIVDALALDRAGRIPRDLALLYFALGEARRGRAEAVRLSTDVSTFGPRLEQRCQLLLSAQSAYSDTMRAYDAHWSTIAGYRVGQLYERLHEELVAIPPPEEGTERERLLFEGAMRLRYSVLLNKASSMLEHTLSMAQRTGESSEWVSRTQEAHRRLQQSVAEEQRALDRLPFSRDDLQRALDDLSHRANGPRSAPAP